MSEMQTPDFATMNETDVREEIVRPLITRLGYKHGTEAYVQTEFKLSYSAAFLGRKDPEKDPPLRGRADYVCGLVAAGRWVIEVKAPHESVADSAVQQAHTYAAHPEVAAYYFIVTNGKNFRLFETGRLDTALLEFSFSEIEQNFLKLMNIVGVDAIRKRAKLVLADPGDPLGVGLHSRLEILKGGVIYDSHDAGSLEKLAASIDGVELPISDGTVSRDPDGRIHAQISIASIAPLMRSLGAVGLGDHYDFFASEKYISVDEEHPTIFQNVLRTNIHQGTPTSFAGMQSIMPFELEVSSFTEVVGFVRGDTFQGTMRIEADVTVGAMHPLLSAYVQKQSGIKSGTHRVNQSGRFHARLGSGL